MLWENDSVKNNLLFHFPISVTQELSKLHSIKSSKNLIQELEKIFDAAKNGSEAHKLFLGDLLLSFHHPDVIKNNESGKQLEKKFEKIFNAKRHDDHKQVVDHELLGSEEFDLNEDAKRKLINNCQAKPDLVFNDGTLLSLKCGIESNTEINLGSFEFLNIIYPPKFAQFRNLKERKRKENIHGFNCGLGSPALLKNTSDALKKAGLFEDFVDRFQTLFNAVYRDDLFFYHKNSSEFSMWLLPHKELQNIIYNNVLNGFKNIRWEGNSIRSSSMSEMISRSQRINYRFEEVLDFNFLIDYFSKS